MSAQNMWLCDLYRESRFLKPFMATKPGEPTEVEATFNPRERMHWRLANGERFAAEDLPDAFYKNIPEHRDVHLKWKHSLLPAFHNGLYCFVNEEIADVMRGFDLGENALHPVTFYLHDCTTRIEEQFYLLHFGVRKRTIDRARSTNVEKRYPSLEEYEIPTSITTSGDKIDLHYHPEALHGPDMWVDPEIIKVFFFSPALGRALSKAGFKSKMRMAPMVKS